MLCPGSSVQNESGRNTSQLDPGPRWLHNMSGAAWKADQSLLPTQACCFVDSTFSVESHVLRENYLHDSMKISSVLDEVLQQGFPHF